MKTVSRKRSSPELCVADARGRIFNVPFLSAVGMRAEVYDILHPARLIRMPCGSQLFMLPGRRPIGFSPQDNQLVTLDRHPFSPAPEPCFAVAAFVAPGYTSTYNAAYTEIKGAPILPLFAYTAVAFYRGEFWVASTRVDRELRQDIRFMDVNRIKKNVIAFRKQFPSNRLVTHLESCALVNQCPAAKNFFLRRYEGPLPTSPSCNARCAGCLSLQPDGACPVTQPRIRFIPSPEEIAEVALCHLAEVEDPVVSFGQGCEGEPLLAGNTIEKAVKLIRARTRKGMININTNASKPDVVARLFDAGMDSIRVSLNSLQPEGYHRYYRPRDYTFSDVMKSVRVAQQKKKFVSVNYLSIPGFTDSRAEVQAFRRFLDQGRVDMIQWRNLNYDPRAYFRLLKFRPDAGALLGMKGLIEGLKKDYPHIMTGYFNPSRRRISRFRKGRVQV
ncbi:MAG TPA: radical SAM protein [Candidatus Omnitrophota bacterium]|nr:radical SAM protein [Candidatus Omnitrophota bacterium]HQP12622.1 radical SAM protein [Candidatus Omnitrophota bacterium]